MSDTTAMGQFGFDIASDGVVTRRRVFREGSLEFTRSQILSRPPQRIYFSQPGPVSWEPMNQAAIRTMNNPELS